MVQKNEEEIKTGINYKNIFKILFFITFVSVTALALLPSEKTFSFSAKDKVNHLIAYVVLTILALQGFQTRRKVISSLGICCCLLFYGILIEWIQGFVGRETSFWDVAANLSGIVVGMSFSNIIKKQ